MRSGKTKSSIRESQRNVMTLTVICTLSSGRSKEDQRKSEQRASEEPFVDMSKWPD